MKEQKVISFDIYDTLIERIVPDKKIYEILSKKYNIQNFLEIRLSAEKKAKYNDKYGYTIYDIYDYIDLECKDKIMNEEIKLEIANTKINKIGLKLYEKYKNDNYLICISDMYFPKEIISKILEKNGYTDIRKIYVSCDYKSSKRNIRLFNIVKKDFNNIKIKHIGDSFRSDYLNALLCGFKIEFLGKNKKDNYAKKISKNDYIYKIGYSIFGPLVFEFCIWLNNHKKDNVVFLSREGDILQKCYNLMFNENTKLAYVSRKSVTSGIVYEMIKNDNVSILINILRKSRSEKINDILNRMTISIKNDIFDDDFLNEYLNSKNEITLENKIYENKDIILESLYENYKKFNTYMNSIIFSNTTVVDVGWNGSMQELLKYYFNSKNIEINGLYLGCLNNNEKDGYLFNKNDDNSMSLLNFSGILELAFMPKYGSIIGYRYDDKVVVPIHDKYEFSEDSSCIIQTLQNGFYRYIKDRKSLGLISIYKNNEIIKLLYELGLKPNKYDISYFGKIEFYDNGKKENIINYKDGLIKSFMKSEWKIAYLKNIFKICLPYNKFLLLLRRRKK